MTEREALKLALEIALEKEYLLRKTGQSHVIEPIITAIKKALAQPEQCRKEQRGNGEYVCDCKPSKCPELAQPERVASQEPVMVTPGGGAFPFAVARKPLTVDEVWQNDQLMALNAELGCGMDLLLEVVEAIEAAHGIKD